MGKKTNARRKERCEMHKRFLQTFLHQARILVKRWGRFFAWQAWQEGFVGRGLPPSPLRLQLGRQALYWPCPLKCATS